MARARWPFRPVAALLVVVLATLGLSSASGASPTPGTISGTVTAALSSAGVSGVCVKVGSFSSVSAIGGAYSVANLTPGYYRVEFSPNCFGQTASPYAYEQSASPVLVTAGATTNNVNVSLVIGGSLTGKVVDSVTDVPIAGLCVTAYSAAVATDNAQSVVESTTAPNGAYSITALAPGANTVTFDPICGGAKLGAPQSVYPETTLPHSFSVTAGAATKVALAKLVKTFTAAIDLKVVLEPGDLTTLARATFALYNARSAQFVWAVKPGVVHYLGWGVVNGACLVSLENVAYSDAYILRMSVTGANIRVEHQGGYPGPPFHYQDQPEAPWFFISGPGNPLKPAVVTITISVNPHETTPTTTTTSTTTTTTTTTSTATTTTIAP